MKTQAAIDYFGNIKKLAAALDVWTNTIGRWGEYPPKAKQYEIEVKTGGKLKAEKE